MFRFVSRTLLKGLAVAAPVAAAVYLIILLVVNTERGVKYALLSMLPERFYVPGMGFVVVVGAVFFLGLLMYPWLTRSLLDRMDKVLRRIPLFSAIYSPIRDLMNLFGGDLKENLGQVVMLDAPNTNMETLGFVTREDRSGLPAGLVKEGHIVVYVPLGYQIGGFCFVVPRDAVRPVNMSVEDGLRWALTAGVSGPAESKADEKPEEASKTDAGKRVE